MPTTKTVLKSVTPGSVKALMIVEAIVIAYFSFWLANEYVYNVYFRINVDSVFVEHLTSYTIAIGLGIGLAGTAVAAALYRIMRETKVKLESVAPKIRGSVEKPLTGILTIDAKGLGSPSSVALVAQSESNPGTPTAAIIVSRPSVSEEKK